MPLHYGSVLIKANVRVRVPFQLCSFGLVLSTLSCLVLSQGPQGYYNSSSQTRFVIGCLIWSQPCVHWEFESDLLFWSCSARWIGGVGGLSILAEGISVWVFHDFSVLSYNRASLRLFGGSTLHRTGSHCVGVDLIVPEISLIVLLSVCQWVWYGSYWFIPASNIRQQNTPEQAMRCAE